MKFRLKKAYQTMKNSFAAGTIKTLKEWQLLMPEIWGLDPVKYFPDWFEKVSTLHLVTRAYYNGKLVPYSGRLDGFRYDGRILTELDINAIVSSYEDVKELIDFLTVVKNCFVDHGYAAAHPQHFPDALGNVVHEQDVVYTKYKTGKSIVEMSASYAFKQGVTFFKSYASAIEYYGL